MYANRNPVFQRGNPLDTHTESKPLIFFRVIPDANTRGLTMPIPFLPIITRANFQRAALFPTANINLGRRLGKRK